MKHFFITVASIIITITQISAQSYDFYNLGNISRYPKEKVDINSQCSEICNEINNPDRLPRNARVRKTTGSVIKFKDVTVTQPGTLASVLGSESNDIDSLVVRGQINAEDIHAIWCCSFYGGLTVANLEFAQIDGNKLPSNAFWYQSEQYPSGSEYIDCIPLRRIILPEGLKEIGESAFCYAIALSDVNFPSSLKAIKRRCFTDCVSLNVNPLVIPEGVEEIGYMAFANCKAMNGKVVLPSTLKIINGGVFFRSKITECNFPEGLEEIGDAAFYATCLKEAMLPNSCQSFSGSDHFGLCYELEKIRFPEGPTLIPVGFVYDCIKLTEFIMPNSIEVIGYGAFWQCGALQKLHLSSNLKSIDKEGLYYCKGLKTICFPSTLETLGAECCEYWKSIEQIYCTSKIPPTCMNSELNPGDTPFGAYGSDFMNRTPQVTPVYVPIGSADLYRNTWGWSYFTNFIETDEFPSAGINDVEFSEKIQDNCTYDLFGRKVETLTPGTIYIRNGKKFIVK